MAITYTWRITAIKKAPSLDGLSDVVTHLNFEYVGTDSENDSEGNAYTAQFSGACPIGVPDPENFTALTSLTEADVISWAQANHPVDHMQEVIIKNISEQKIPKNIKAELPWSSDEDEVAP
jgi:hypothetical protein